ncbi:pseudouridine synthase [uncultured Alistipes sp.]|uniref:pseudouridine synthase n=1 Tax=uncultured Alistipes sp. TaxID=538949 RepID=UPI002638DDD4|nr:pseudouridine synthase [uncultured Alistipes sp.]
MKDYNSDSTAVLDRFARDRRKRTTTAERVERRPDPRREAGDTAHGHAARRASFNPNFTKDNRPVGEHPSRPAGGSRYGSARPSGRYGAREEREERSSAEYGTYADSRSEGEGRPARSCGRKGGGRPSAAGRVSEGRNPFRASAPKGAHAGGEDRSERRSGERGGTPYRGGGKPAGGVRRTPRGEERPKSYPRYNPNVQTGEIRLNRFIAQSGLCSRREADDYIQAGLVSVNGVVVTELGTKVKPTDEVRFNDTRVEGEKKVYLVLNKPKGFVTSLDDPHADRTVMDLVRGACEERIYPVGRLDKSSVGLLLFTNDGDLTRQLTHPSYRKKKIYQVTLDKPLTRADMDRIAEGITLEDGEIHADEIAYVKENKTEIGVEIHSGRNRIVRRIFESLGYTVRKLDRVYYAGLTKKNLKRGAWRFLTREEVMRLKTGQYE